ncbi:hypothetical protein [Candidatus Thiodictyon syntrophicum]|uniref:Uncharacterized protein n=1 Tax=Candidatus Thiodictyon syntrophicum TaxID=1166950 RepID=A0A2K8U6L5_9GAMM|nr:hypothetical protein [Candidatus Thiodictyon syntrophicum]AUB81232.1 hypothetical protein THSYN_09890 [Candidatus Thiodictyon syntrophicum]
MLLLLFKALVIVYLVVVVWHLRARPAFPRDLVYRVEHWESAEPGASQEVEPWPLFATLFGLRPRQRIDVLGEERPIAEIFPTAGRKHQGALFALRPGRGFRIGSGDGPEAGAAGVFYPEVCTRYRLWHDDSDKSYSFMLEYR